MINPEIAHRIAFPTQIEKAILNYMIAQGGEIGNSKTIATQLLYHQKNVTSQGSVSFFTGQYDQNNTNIETSSFQRPKTEHFVIFGVRVLLAEEGSALLPENALYVNGVSGSSVLGSTGFKMQTSTFDMYVNGVIQLKNMPMSESDAEIQTDDQGIIELNEPIFWGGQTELKIILNAKPGYTFGDPALNEFQYVRYELMGIGLIS